MSILVYTENWDGKFKKLSFELVSYASEIAKQLNTSAIALSIGEVEENEFGSSCCGRISFSWFAWAWNWYFIIFSGAGAKRNAALRLSNLRKNLEEYPSHDSLELEIDIL